MSGGPNELNRRSLLKTVCVATAGAAAAGFSGLGAAATTVNGISFDRVVNAVEDLGMDPNGNDPIDAAFDNAKETGTLIEFPPGTYLVAEDHYSNGVSRFGVRGTGSSRNDVVFRPPSGSAVAFLQGGGPGPFMIENVSFDELDDDTSMMYMDLASDEGVRVRDVEFLGKTPLDDASDYTINADVGNQDAVAIYENVDAGLDQPAVPADYPDGVAFIRAGPGHNGEVVIRDCAIHERNSAATRLTNCSGVTTIEGGEFVNNQNANIRFGAGDHPSKVSSATGTYVKVDGSRNTSDAVRLDCSSNGYAGAVFKDLEIEWSKNSGSIIDFPGWAGHGRAEFYNCVVRNDGDNTMTVNAEPVDVADDEVIIENCAFTGTGKGFDAYDRDGSVIRDSCIDMPNASISTFDTVNVSTGGCRTPGGDSTQDTNSGPTASITVTNTDGLTVDLSGADSTDSDGNIASYAWNVGGTSYTGQTVTHTFGSGGTYTVELTVTDDTGATGTATKDVTVESDAYENTLVIKGTGTTTEYAFEVSGGLQGIDSSIEEWDSVSGSSATGYVTDTTDSDEFTYDGEITSFEFLEGEAEVYRNGTRIYPTRSRLSIRGTGSVAEYDFAVSGDLTPIVDTIESWDQISGSSANGYVTDTNDVDEFDFTGEFTSFSFPRGDADVYVDGELIDISTL